MVASSGAQLLEDDAVDALIGALFPLAMVVTPNLMEARALTGSDGTRRELAERLHALGAPAVVVTGGHGEPAVDHLFDGREHVEIPVERHDIPATHGAGCTHSATLAALLARGESLTTPRAVPLRPRRARSRKASSSSVPEKVPSTSWECDQMISAATTLRALREQKPLVHQITNYVVMNETANATLAIGALPVMAHAREEVEEMARHRLVTRPEHRHALPALGRGDGARGGAATARGIPIVLDPVGAGATQYRTATARRCSTSPM